MGKPPVEQFAALSGLPGIVHAFTQRVPGLDVSVDRDVALRRLDEHHTSVRLHLGLAEKTLITAVQVHGNQVAIVNADTPVPVPNADGLVTDDPKVCLGIYVADCCAVYLVDLKRRSIGLVHSGKKGTEQGISGVAVNTMRDRFGSEPKDIVALLGPCIRPPHYEVDFSRQIADQLWAAGVREVHDSGSCTASDPERYYSYRREKGKTGRMLALLALDSNV